MVVRNMQQTPMNGPASSCRASRTPASAVRDRTIKSSNSNVKVVVRIRPENIKEKDGNFSNVVQALDDHILVFDPADDSKDGFGSAGARRYDILKKKSRDMRFAFDRVFDPNAINRQVYEHCVRSILDCLLNGINCSVFAYGATGAGKTHTMLGNMECPGVTFHTMMELYERIEDMKDEKSCDVAVSYLEIYNETIQDLLKPSGALPIREDPNSGIVIKGLTLHKPKDAKDLLEMLYYGNQNRTQHPTDANKESSRSHAVFQVFVRQKDRTASLTADIHMAKMSLIDLAGSERATATANRGARLREGANINRSLLALGNVINALADGRVRNQHIPYRDSKLTRLLKDSIGGNCSTVMITAVSPSAMSYEDTLNSLKYADRAKNIKATLKKNVLSVDMHVSRYVKIVEELRTEISELKLKLQSYEGGLMTPFHQRQADTAKQEDINRLKTLFSTIFTKRLSLRNEIMEYECSERDLTLKIHQKQQVLSRLGVVSSDKTRSEKVHSKLNHAIDAAEKRRDTILSRKADVNSRLKENNDWFTRTENEAKLIGENCNALPEVNNSISKPF
ncbi:kinesin-like protein KIF18A [Tubulanus polymorphus]|uniref:kinesin-like protein KIF18A n=1 Tax=Tubulanus polymorphus TaxID=672921 RepID=UPI003DA27A41